MRALFGEEVSSLKGRKTGLGSSETISLERSPVRQTEWNSSETEDLTFPKQNAAEQNLNLWAINDKSLRANR
jgi:hypothetical protein